MTNNVQKKGGRKPQSEKKNDGLRVRLNESEQAKLQRMMDEFGQSNMSKFVRNCLFNREIRVVKTDTSLYKTIEFLTKILAQYRAVGVNYNQTVKHVNTCFGEHKAARLLKNLEGYTAELVKLGEQLKAVTEELMKKYHDRQDEHQR
jgi:predicted regulator of amino acid metabolism with ACT domain